MQLVWLPSPFVDEPAAHCVHVSVPPETAPYQPAAQTQPVWPLRLFVDEPVGHVVQLVELVLEEKVPDAHALHDEPADVAAVPAAHTVQGPPAALEPAGHG